MDDFMAPQRGLRKEYGHVRYPQHPNFWTTDGNLEAFVTYPRLETQRLNKVSTDLNFTNIDPESIFSLPVYTNGNLGGKTQGKAFVKATIDAETYWLQTPDSKWNCYKKTAPDPNLAGLDEPACIAAGGVWMNGSCQSNYTNGTILGKHASEKSCRDNGGFWQENSPESERTFFRPYALIKVASPVFYEKDDFIKVRDNFVGCKDPKRFKVAPNYFKRGVALGLCRDKRPAGPLVTPRTPLGLDDRLYADAHRKHMNEGYGCHYKSPCRDEITIIPGFVPLLFHRAVSFKRVLENGRKPIQDEATCLRQPAKDMLCPATGMVIQSAQPEWSPKNVCEEMTYGITTTLTPSLGAKWLPAGNTWNTCDNLDLRKTENDGALITKWARDVYKFENVEQGEGYQYIDIHLEATQSLSKMDNAKNTIENIFFGGQNSMANADKSNMAAARYKPWYAGVPQQSNRFTWGPWGQASNFGKAEVIFDDSYHPGAYGGVGPMNSAALSKISNSTNAGAHLENENGSVTISGLPEYKMGSPMQLYMVSGFSDINVPAIGPYITDIAIDIGTDGVSTTYRMQTQRSFGDLASLYERQLQSSNQRSIEIEKKQADANKETRRVDINSNQRINPSRP